MGTIVYCEEREKLQAVFILRQFQTAPDGALRRRNHTDGTQNEADCRQGF